MDHVTVMFGGWAHVARTLVVGVLGFIALLVFLRLAGKRTLAKMNVLDIIVSVALGSTLAAVMLTPSRDCSRRVLGTRARAVFARLSSRDPAPDPA